MAKARSKTLEPDVRRDPVLPVEVSAELVGPSPIEEALKETTAVTEPGPAPTKGASPSSPPTNAPEPKVAAQPVAVVPLEVFRQVSGVKPDQFAGFAWYAKREGLMPQPVASWREEYERFLGRSVG